MQLQVPKQDIEKLSAAVERLANAAADCVRQVAVHDPAQTDIVTGAEQILSELEDVTRPLKLLRGRAEVAKAVASLRKIERTVKWIKQSADLYLVPSRESTGDNEIRRAVVECLSSCEAFVRGVEHVLTLDEVCEVRLSYRAKVAEDNARTIASNMR